MKKIKILTATYNHCSWLSDLYSSLCEQTNKDFLWVIIDDGSSDDTEKVVSSFISEGRVDIEYIKKTNGGKSSAVNMGLDTVGEQDFAVIIDDDETLVPNAVDQLFEYYDKYFGTDVGVIHFHRRNKATGELFANYKPNGDLKKSYLSFMCEHLLEDGYVSYFGYAVKGRRFPLFEGEKYVGPSVLIILCNSEYEMVWADATLGESEYMEGGITHAGRRLRVKNPCGMIYRCILQQDKQCTLAYRLKYSMAGFAYQKLAGYTTAELAKKGLDMSKLCPLMRPFGLLLALKWKKHLPKKQG